MKEKLFTNDLNKGRLDATPKGPGADPKYKNKERRGRMEPTPVTPTPGVTENPLNTDRRGTARPWKRQG